MVRDFLVGNSRNAVCRRHTDALYQVHYDGRVEYEQYRAEYTALWHAELHGWSSLLSARHDVTRVVALAQIRCEPREC